MKYIKTDIEYEPKITGSPNGVYAVEIKDKKSFKSQDEKDYFNNFIKENRQDITRLYEDSFVKIDNKMISEIIYFPSYKRTKDIDVVLYCPYQNGFKLLISEKAFEIIRKYKTPILNIIPSKIDSFEKRYFMIGFPMIVNKMIDFEKSRFYDSGIEQEITYDNYENYAEINFNRTALSIHLSKSYDYDIINLQGEGLYFSENLTMELEENRIIGFVRKKSILYNDVENKSPNR